MPKTNRLLESLPAETRSALVRASRPVDLPVRTPLFSSESKPKYVHFITSGIASTVALMEGGQAVEVGITGCEGFPEKIHVLGPQFGSVKCFMQVPGTGLSMRYEQFRAEMMARPDLLKAVLEYVQQDNFVLSQLAACNRMHEVEARLARWLLMVQDRVGGNEFKLTQEFLGEMLGTRRSSVNLAMGSLQRSGLIEHGREKIHIPDAEALKGVACECYPIVARLFKSLYK